MNIKNINNNNYKLSMVKTDKFKTTRIQINFLSDMTNSITSRSLLPYLLRAVSKEYPKREQLNTYLEEMYAAQFGVSLSKIGLTHGIVFDLSVIDDFYTSNNESLLEKAFKFLESVIFNPLFDKTIFNEEYRLLKEYFDGVYSNKMKYAAEKLVENMFQDELYKYSSLGSIEGLKNVTLNTVKSEYQKMINNNSVYITIVGNIDFDKTENIINNIFTFNKNINNHTLIDHETTSRINIQEIIEDASVNQSKLVMGYRTNVWYNEKNYYDEVVFNAMFGGSSDSLLFTKIREEMGKVYFINSSYDPYKGVMFIYSGINKDDYTTVINEINNVLEDIIEGNYSDKLLKTTKTIIKNSVLSSLDSTYSLTSRYFKASLFDKEFNLDNILSKLENVNKDGISLVAKKLVKDTIFFLKEQNNDEKI